MNVKYFLKNCTSNLNILSEICLHISSNIYTIQRCFTESLPVIKSGVFNRNREKKSMQRKTELNLAQKKCAYLVLMLRTCLHITSITRGLFTMNSLHTDKL